MHYTISLVKNNADYTGLKTQLVFCISNTYFVLKIVSSRCGCDECVTSRYEDSLRHSRSRINAYRALASPSLIALSSKDPILTAFELSWELRRFGGDLKRNRVGSIISVSD